MLVINYRFGLPSELLLLKAVRNLLASVESLPWLSRLAEEFKVTALDGLSTLAQAVRVRLINYLEMDYTIRYHIIAIV